MAPSPPGVGASRVTGVPIRTSAPAAARRSIAAIASSGSSTPASAWNMTWPPPSNEIPGQRCAASAGVSSSAGTPHERRTACSRSGFRLGPKSTPPVRCSSDSPDSASSCRQSSPACPVSRTYSGSGYARRKIRALPCELPRRCPAGKASSTTTDKPRAAAAHAAAEPARPAPTTIRSAVAVMTGPPSDRRGRSAPPRRCRTRTCAAATGRPGSRRQRRRPSPRRSRSRSRGHGRRAPGRSRPSTTARAPRDRAIRTTARAGESVTAMCPRAATPASSSTLIASATVRRTCSGSGLSPDGWADLPVPPGGGRWPAIRCADGPRQATGPETVRAEE